jgi:hypothetical protein
LAPPSNIDIEMTDQAGQRDGDGDNEEEEEDKEVEMYVEPTDPPAQE